MKRSLLLAVLLCAAALLAVVLWPDGDSAPEPAPPAPPAAAGAGDATPAVGGPASATAPARDTTRREVGSQRQRIAPASAQEDAEQGVRGIVVDGDGRPLAGVDAYLVESPGNDPLGRMLGRAQQVPTPPTAATVTDAEGGFRLGLGEPSRRRYEVHLLAQGFASASCGELVIHPGEWLDLDRIALHPGTTIRGRITIAGTELPAPQAMVELDTGDPFQDLGGAELPGWRARRVAHADAQGNYVLEHAPRAGLFRLTASAPGFARQCREQVEVDTARGARVDFALEAGLVIAGRLDSPGPPITRVQIEAWSETAEPPHQGAVQASGAFEVAGLAEGTYVLRIAAEGFEPTEVRKVEAGDRNVRVALEPRGAARVLVRDPQGRVLRAYRLAVRRWFEDDQIAAVRDVPDRTISLQPHEDHAEVRGIDRGVYRFQVFAEGYAPTLSAPFELDAEHRSAEVTVVMDRGGALRGTVTDERGAPVAGAAVVTQPDGVREDNPVWRMVRSLVPDRVTRTRTETDADGAFLLEGLAHARYQLVVTHPDFCRTTRRAVPIEADRERAMPPVVLVRGARVTGRTFVDGALAGQVRVILTPPRPAAGAAQPGPASATESTDETTLVRVEAVSDNAGTFELPQRVPPGDYELRATRTVGNTQPANVFEQFHQMQQSMQVLRVSAGQQAAQVEIRLRTDEGR